MAGRLTRKILAYLVIAVGSGLYVSGMFGVSDTDKSLRREVSLQQSILELERSDAGPDRIERFEEQLERLRNRRSSNLRSESAVLNVVCIVGGILVFIGGFALLRTGRRRVTQQAIEGK